MCGFVVTQNKNMVVTMLEKQRFRGPDSVGFWADAKIAMGHALLDISGEAQAQPLVTKKGNIIVFNGEMYDSIKPNDTQFLANGYETYGLAFLQYTNWHGSIAIYNPKKQTLTLVRDQFGSKPLWFYRKGKSFAASTSLKSFIIKKRDKKQDKDFMFNPLWVGNRTPYHNIAKVGPGEIVTVDLKTMNLSRKNLWQDYQIRSKKFDLKVFREKTISSIQKVAKNKQKTGIFLSGGLDSTFALSVVKDMNIDLTAYILEYDESKGSINDQDGFRKESRMAVKTCKEWGVPYKLVQLHQLEVGHLGKSWIANTHYTWVDRNRQAPRYKLCQAASRDGCKVILTGDSADELYTGYIHHHKRFDPGYDNESVKRVKKYDWFPSGVFSKTDSWNNGLFIDLLGTSEQNILTTDQTCGMFGMESRPVFLSQNYVQYIFQHSGVEKFKQHPGWQKGTYKYLLREVLGDMLPKHVRERKNKTGWSSPWNNNVDKLQDIWHRQDLDFLDSL